MADRKAQEAIFREVMNQLLQPSGKTIEPKAFQQILENTGYDLSSFAGSLKKLIDFSGTEPRITTGHVAAVLKRTKEDPIYELTGAVADRNVHQALFFLSSLLSVNIYPLQILAAISNQMQTAKMTECKVYLQHNVGVVGPPVTLVSGTCTVPEPPLPSPLPPGDFVRVTVCAEALQLAPNLLKSCMFGGLDISTWRVRETTTMHHEYD